jgi:hypothetical protein
MSMNKTHVHKQYGGSFTRTCPVAVNVQKQETLSALMVYFYSLIAMHLIIIGRRNVVACFFEILKYD